MLTLKVREGEKAEVREKRSKNLKDAIVTKIPLKFVTMQKSLKCKIQ